MGQLIGDFEACRTKMNDRIMGAANTNIKGSQFYNNKYS
jgi:hypothetical protein